MDRTFLFQLKNERKDAKNCEAYAKVILYNVSSGLGFFVVVLAGYASQNNHKDTLSRIHVL
jgi:hypothetical protein